MSSVRKQRYILTETAEADFYAAVRWSLSRWGKKLTGEYFSDIEKGAIYIAENPDIVAKRDLSVENTGLGIYPVREHYIIYIPLSDGRIIIVALLRQVMDVAEILRRNAFKIRREVDAINRMMN